MLDYLDSMCLRAKIRFMAFVDGFKRDEMGVSAFVATVLLIVIVVALAAIFWDKIKDWMEHALDNVFGDADKIAETN